LRRRAGQQRAKDKAYSPAPHFLTPLRNEALTQVIRGHPIKKMAARILTAIYYDKDMPIAL
jgi:hypothetical protein